VAVAVAATFCGFVAWRIAKAPPVPPAETDGFSPMTAQAPLAVDLAFSQEEPPGPAA
jgi:hypothetical protein